MLKTPLPEKPAAVASVITGVAPDILLVSGFDYDAGHHALTAFQRTLARQGHPLPHAYTAAPNRGRPTGLDIDRDGRLGEPEDTQGFATFRGAGGMALLSRFPIQHAEVEDFSELLWSDFPAANLPFEPNGPEAAVLRLSTSGHWRVPVQLPNGAHIQILSLHATPPVFDGPEDRNGRRNADQLRFWADFLNGWHPLRGTVAPPRHAVVLGTLNADPADGEARSGAVSALLNHPALQDPRPASEGGARAAAEQGGINGQHLGPAMLDTVDWPDDLRGAPGNLRVDYILPARGLRVLDAGVHWPIEGNAAKTAQAASRHRLVWVDIATPPAP
ncbi:endonuclease/exonuclease/phosphatase family protein [Tropicimonas sp. S265A]|uniref:endonuclease/exonuclease/phosphatase family protein n=1 Tax=Tropicimonas sp. S265A TaxID=3415134 RepID=UPI003C7ADB1A